MRLLKRSAECEALDQLLADAAAGRSRVAVLRGEAGEGKTTLLDYLAERVQSWNVATAVGVESEVELDYSGRHQLCTTPCAGCPSPQREALATAGPIDSRRYSQWLPNETPAKYPNVANIVPHQHSSERTTVFGVRLTGPWSGATSG